MLKAFMDGYLDRSMVCYMEGRVLDPQVVIESLVSHQPKNKEYNLIRENDY